MKKYAVIVAGGAGLRMGMTMPKQFLLLQEKPVLWYSITAFLTAFPDINIILVLPAAFIEAGNAMIATTAAPQLIQSTAGGETRYQSVKNGLKLVEKNSVVFVHDGVRCLVSPALIKRCYETTLGKGNAVPAIAAVDSIRIENGQKNTVMDRNKVRIIQTPQTFLSDDLVNAFDQPYDIAFTDEATVVEKAGATIHLIEGEASNIKITTPLDLLVAEKLLEERAAKP